MKSGDVHVIFFINGASTEVSLSTLEGVEGPKKYYPGGYTGSVRPDSSRPSPLPAVHPIFNNIWYPLLVAGRGPLTTSVLVGITLARN
jgi:hypothetical protein